MNKRVIVALSGAMGIEETKDLMEELQGEVRGFKFHAPRAIRFLQQGFDPFAAAKRYGYEIFADIKGHDNPEEVAEMVRDLEAAGADILTVHASGGETMLRKAVAARTHAKIFAVTVLTSMKDQDVEDTYRASKNEQVACGAALAYNCGCDGTISSAADLAYLDACAHVGNGRMLRCTPGIRFKDERVANDDQNQARVLTPREAMRVGADMLVIGRPITRAINPAAAARRAEAQAVEGLRARVVVAH